MHIDSAVTVGQKLCNKLGIHRENIVLCPQ